jgi:hypothetical protein
MKIKTSELTGAALGWAVAKCEGLLALGWEDDMGLLKITFSTGEAEYYAPSIKWEQGGPIIEREWIDLHCVNDSLWEAECPANCGLAMQKGPTPLSAAMRCYIASKLGDDVEIPEELT